MTQLRRLEVRLSEKRSAFLALTLWMLLGSLCGAMSVKIRDFALSSESVFHTGPGSLLVSAFRCLIFPSLMAAALLLHSRRLFCFLFFGKGFCVACVLCAFAAVGLDALKRFLHVFFLETLLPLPALLLLGVLWYEDAGTGRTDLRPVFPALLAVFSGLLLEVLIFQ